MRFGKICLCFWVFAFGAGAGFAVLAEPVTYKLPPETAVLKPGPDVGTVQANCSVCHSVDYIAIQPPGRGEKFWKAEVHKMITIFGASVSLADADKIAAYLAKTY